MKVSLGRGKGTIVVDKDEGLTKVNSIFFLNSFVDYLWINVLDNLFFV